MSLIKDDEESTLNHCQKKSQSQVLKIKVNSKMQEISFKSED